MANCKSNVCTLVVVVFVVIGSLINLTRIYLISTHV